MLPKQTAHVIFLLFIAIGVICFMIYLIFTTHPIPLPQRIFYADSHVKMNATLTLHELPPYIARKIYDLAILQNDLCTITHEKFQIGDIAVMPCGHIFCKSALQKYFSTVHETKCVICKCSGVPSYM
jgi:hypothetical protein